MSDTILLLGDRDGKQKELLGRAGYNALHQDPKVPLGRFIVTALIDAIVLDERGRKDALDLCEVLRKDPTSKRLPLIFISAETTPPPQLVAKGYDRFEILGPEFGIAELMSKLATQIRLRKMSGLNPAANPTLGEMNSALKDLNQRFARELEEARQIQQGLLPAELPKEPTYEFAAHYSPLEEVGGDWYWVAKQKSGKVVGQISDVTGHGISAAFIGCMQKLALAAVNEDDPGRQLTAINRLMTPQMPPGRFVTVASLLYDPTNGELLFSRAGHPPGLLLNRATGEIIQSKGGSLPIGFMDDTEYDSEKIQLGINDVFVLYTDGITEAQNRSWEMYGMDRFCAALKRCDAAASAEEIKNALLADFDGFIEGRRLKDDVTLVVMKRCG